MDKNLQSAALFDSISKLVWDAQKRVYQKVNSELIQLYWNIGRLIVEDEQKGSSRATYGEEVLKNLSESLMIEFGKGFDYTNLTNMRKFYMAFPILDALRHELSWTHYRILSRVENEQDRIQYMQLAVNENWNTRQLERSIRSGYLGRMLEEPGKDKTKTTQAFIKDPYIFEFLGLKPDVRHHESTY